MHIVLVTTTAGRQVHSDNVGNVAEGFAARNSVTVQAVVGDSLCRKKSVKLRSANGRKLT